MRDIKFRAYYPTLGLSAPFELGRYPKWGNKTLSYWAKKCKFEQFTGLLDKDGKDIYEGDILRFSINDNEFNIAICKFGTVDKKIVDAFDGSIRDAKITGFYFAIDGFPCFPFDFFPYAEVIGNIHSNPELLEAKT